MKQIVATRRLERSPRAACNHCRSDRILSLRFSCRTVWIRAIYRSNKISESSLVAPVLQTRLFVVATQRLVAAINGVAAICRIVFLGHWKKIREWNDCLKSGCVLSLGPLRLYTGPDGFEIRGLTLKIASNVSFRLKRKPSTANLDLCLRKTRSGKSRDYRDVIAFEKRHFPLECFPSTLKRKAPGFREGYRSNIQTFQFLRFSVDTAEVFGLRSVSSLGHLSHRRALSSASLSTTQEKRGTGIEIDCP